MRPSWTCLFAFAALCILPASSQTSSTLQEKRQSPSDLEVSGAVAGLPPESTRYITWDALLKLPQTSVSVTDDANFKGPAKIGGVRLEDLARAVGVTAASYMAVAICDDGYRANYPRAYLEAHHPVLVLEINGQPPAGWPKAAEDNAADMGPYLISNPKFTPNFKVLSHLDEAQIPWGVVRVEFRDEKTVLKAIAPRGTHAKDRKVQDGFGIAEQNCFRCHNAGGEGGQKAGIPWGALGAMAARSPMDFAAYVRAPKSKNPSAQMPGNPQYDDATLAALTAYFRTFSGPAKP
jgi:mono/diheme cytochrome c family protein